MAWIHSGLAGLPWRRWRKCAPMLSSSGFDFDAMAVVGEVVPVEEDGAERGHEAVGDVEGGVVGVGLGFGLDGGEHGDANAEDVHGMRGGGNLLEGDFDGLGEAAKAAETLLVVS